MTIGIVGLGLIGGSLAKAIRENTDHKILGTDTNPDTMAMALVSGSIDSRLETDGIADCDIIILALPPRALVDWARENAGHISGNSIVVDVCGVKRVIFDCLSSLALEYGFLYVGGHPMAGKEVSGFVNASADLYAGASMILTPMSNVLPQLLDTLSSFFLSIGFGRITFSDPDTHDRTIAYTSQLAHVASSAYIKSPAAQLQKGYSAGSFRDMTRVAKLDENLWTELFAMNRDYLSAELERLIGNLTQYLEALQGEDWDRLRELLREGRELKEASDR